MSSHMRARSIVEAAWLNQTSSIGQVSSQTKHKSVINMGWIAAIAWLILALTNGMNDELILASIELSIAALTIVLGHALAKGRISIGLTTNVLTAAMFVVFSYIFLSSGVEGSGAYTAFIFPLVAIFFKGRYIGVIWVGIFAVVNTSVLLFMYFSNQALPYSDFFLQRIAIIYLFVSFFIYIFETMHSKYQLQREFDQSKFRTLIENASDIVAMIDPIGKVHFLSPSFERIMGYKLDEMMGQKLYQYIHPDDVLPVMSIVSDAVLTLGSIQHVECQFLRIDQTWHHLELLAQATMDESRVVSIIINARDLTERVHIEAALNKSEEKYSKIFQSSRDSIIIHNMGGHIIDANQTALDQFAYNLEDMCKFNMSNLLPESLIEHTQEAFSLKKKAGENHFVAVLQRKSGELFKGEVTLDSLEINHTRIIQCVIRDITERETLKDQLLQAKKMEAIGTLVGGIAHDFNNMLAAMDGNIYLAKTRLGQEHDAMGKLDNIERLSMRAAQMVKQLLTFSRKGHVEMRLFSLNIFIKEALQLSKTTIPKNIHHTCEICVEDVVIRGNKTMLQQVLMNLLNNACDAVSELVQPEIHCSLETIEITDVNPKPSILKNGRYACFTMRDNGHGITQEHIENIFEPFFSTKETGKGTGLGLAMVYGAIQSHHGAIEVESDVGEGAIFHVYLPQQSQSTGQAQNLDVVTVSGGDETILLVDDDSDVRAATCEVLEGMGYKVLNASGGQDALDMFKANQDVIDAVISDVVMPHMSGVELIKAIRQVDKAKPVILASGGDTDLILEGEQDMGQVMLISKPFVYEKLSQMLRKLFEA